MQYKIMIKVNSSNGDYYKFLLNPDGTDYSSSSLPDLQAKYTELLQTYKQSDLIAVQDLTVVIDVVITDPSI